MKEALHILHLEDCPEDARLVRLRLQEAFGPRCHLEQARSGPEFAAALDRGTIDIVLSDSGVPGFDSLMALHLTQSRQQRTPFICVSGAPAGENTERLLAAGAAEFVSKSRLHDLASAVERALRSHDPSDFHSLPHAAGLLIATVQKLSLARSVETVQEIVRHAARTLTGADGATFVLREGDQCFYADEDAISPLWKGSRFPLSACISGWAMLHRQPAIIEDIYADERIPHDAYRPTFVKSLVMVPIRTAAPIGAIGNYWAAPHLATPEEVRLLQALADSTSIAIENIQLYADLERRIRERTAELEEANRDLEAFSYSVSHDLRTPLASISMFAELTQVDDQSRLGVEAQENLTSIVHQVARMNDIIDDLLTLARIGRAPLERTAVDLAAIAREIISGLCASAPRRDVEFLCPGQLLVDGDPGLLRVVMENLLGNAWKYSSKRAHTRIELGTVPGATPLTCFIRDNGAGFDPANAGKLFGVFERLHPASDFPGTGIGLTTVQRIVHKHGGRIWAEAAVDRGATFSFTLG